MGPTSEFVAKQYQPKETGAGGECSLVGLCGLQMFSKCVANSIKGKIHPFQRGIPLQRNTTGPNRQGEGRQRPSHASNARHTRSRINPHVIWQGTRGKERLLRSDGSMVSGEGSSDLKRPRRSCLARSW